MIEFTPGGYDKNVKQIQAEARAALLYEIDTAMRDLQAAAVTAGGSYTLPGALEIAFDMLRQRLQVVSPTPDDEPGECCPECDTPAGFPHQAGCEAPSAH